MASSAPPTPTSLLGLPTAWLLQLATTFVMDEDGATVLALVRTCAFFRDALRKTTVAFSVPIDDDEEFWGVEDELCAVARRGGNIRLRVVAEAANVGAQITRLLRRAAARLGGERPLACIKSVHLRVRVHFLVSRGRSIATLRRWRRREAAQPGAPCCAGGGASCVNRTGPRRAQRIISEAD